jgi:pimeloyl-ACP methyl ester carboxylesterase
LTVRFAEVDGGPVGYRESGTGEPVLIAAGLGLSSRFYSGSYPAFARAGYRLIVPDPPGFGRTRAGRWQRDVAGFAEFMVRFAAALGIGRAAWVGHSVGAQIAVEVAARHPDAAAALALCGPTGLRRRKRLRGQVIGLAREAARLRMHVIGAVAADYIRTTPARYIGLWHQASRHDVLGRAALVRCPLLVMVGTEDPVVGEDDLGELLVTVAGSRLVRVAGAGHGLPRERPAAFNRAVIDFLDGQQPRAVSPPASLGTSQRSG